MKKWLFVAALMLAAGSAKAAGSNMAWNDCVAGGGVADRTVACTNTGSGFAHVSLDPPQTYPNIGATDVYIDVVPPNPPGAWWNPTPSVTRWGSTALEPSSGACPAWWGGAPNGGITFQPPQGILREGGTKLRLKITTVIGAGEEQAMTPGTEYFMGALQLKFNAGTAGDAECNAGAAIGIADINVLQPGVDDSHVGQLADVANCVTFRNPPSKQCPGATPTKVSTWGQIKAMYR